MADPKEFFLEQLPEIPRIKRTLFYRYGSSGLSPWLDVSLGLQKKAEGAGERLARAFNEEGADVVIEIGRNLEKLKALGDDLYQEKRFRILGAYLDFLVARKRPPSLTELRRLEWEDRVKAAIDHNDHSEYPSRQKLAEIFDEKVDDKSITEQPIDPRTFQDDTKWMGLTLLDGQKLRRYRSLYRKMIRDAGTAPDMVRFTDEALRKWPDEPPDPRRLSIVEFIEVLAAPFSVHPYHRWVQGTDLYLGAIDQYSGEAPDDRKQAEDIRMLYWLLFKLGVELEVMVEGSQPSPLLTDDKTARALKKQFLELAERENSLPDFTSFWLASSESAEFLAGSGALTSAELEMYKSLVSSFREASKNRDELTVAALADTFPFIGTMADWLKPEIHSRGIWIYFTAVENESKLSR